MALTGAERQRRHRQKMKAKGQTPKPRKKPAKSTTEELMEKRQKATERQRRRRQRIQVERNRFVGHPLSDPTITDDTFVVKHEQDMLLGSNGEVLEHQGDVGGFIIKQDPEIRLDISGLVVEAAREASENLKLGCHGDDGISGKHQTNSGHSEQVTEMILAQQRLEAERDEARDFGGVSIGQVVYQSTSHASLDALIAQQRLQRRRWCAAERQRKRRSRLRVEGKYQEYRQKHNITSSRHRTKQKEQEKTLPERLRREVVAKRREDTRLRVARHRERKKEISKEWRQCPAMVNCGEIGMVPYALQTVECQTVTHRASVLNSTTAYMHNSSPESQTWSPTGEDDTQSDALPVDYHSSHRYVTPPIWPCVSNNQIGERPSPVTSMLSNQDGERLGTTKVSQENLQQVMPRPIYANESHLETQSSLVRTSKANVDPRDSDIVRIELVMEFDQDPPYKLDHLSQGLNIDDMPEDLRNELQTMQQQSPLAYNYIKKLQSNIANLTAENQQLHKRTLGLDEIKTDKAAFQFWTGFPNYDSFKEIFERLKPNIGPVTSPHLTDTPTLEEEFFYVLARLRVGLFVKDIATRIGISEADYVLMFHRWIMALLHNLPSIFQVPDGTDGKCQNQTEPRVMSLTDCAKVLVDCSDMLSAEAVRKWTNTHIELLNRYKFVMGVSFASGSVLYVSDVSPNESDSYSMLVRLSHLHSTVVGTPGGQGDLNVGSEGLVQGQGDPLIKVVNHIRSFHILDNYQMKLQCETFRAVFKVCALLSNVMK